MAINTSGYIPHITTHLNQIQLTTLSKTQSYQVTSPLISHGMIQQLL